MRGCHEQNFAIYYASVSARARANQLSSASRLPTNSTYRAAASFRYFLFRSTAEDVAPVAAF
jgi:hypothetical protein